MFCSFIILVKLQLCIFNSKLQTFFSQRLIVSLIMSILQMLKETIVDCPYLMNCRALGFQKCSGKSKKWIQKSNYILNMLSLLSRQLQQFQLCTITIINSLIHSRSKIQCLYCHEICETSLSYHILNHLQCLNKFLTFMKTFMSLGINIDCICDKSDLKSTVKNVNIKTESVITKCYQRLVLQSVFSKDIMLSTDFTSSSSKLIEIDSFVASIFNSDISFFITS